MSAMQGLRGRRTAASLLVVGAAVAALAIVRATGGGESEYQPLLYLPVVLAVAGASLPVALAVGLLLSLASFFALHPSPLSAWPTREDALRAVTINVMTLIGAVYAQLIEGERVRMHRRMAEQDLLLNATQIVQAASKLEYAVHSVLEMLPRIVPELRCAAVYLSDERGTHLELYDIVGIDRADIRAHRLRAADWPHWRTGRPHHVEDTLREPANAMARLDPGARSVLALPLGGRVGGMVLTCASPGAFTPERQTLLAAFAERVSLPLQKVRLQEGLEDLAFTDAMTGLFNFRCFRSHLENEIKRSVRYRRPVSLIILDLDDFKAVNDRHGHPAGDRVLAAVAAIIRDNIRETDIAAR